MFKEITKHGTQLCYNDYFSFLIYNNHFSFPPRNNNHGKNFPLGFDKLTDEMPQKAGKFPYLKIQELAEDFFKANGRLMDDMKVVLLQLRSEKGILLPKDTVLGVIAPYLGLNVLNRVPTVLLELQNKRGVKLTKDIILCVIVPFLT